MSKEEEDPDDDPHRLNTKDRDKIVAFIAEKLPGWTCKKCGHAEYFVSDNLVSPLLVSPKTGKVQLGGGHLSHGDTILRQLLQRDVPWRVAVGDYYIEAPEERPSWWLTAEAPHAFQNLGARSSRNTRSDL
jgi:hypothetical protein